MTRRDDLAAEQESMAADPLVRNAFNNLAANLGVAFPTQSEEMGLWIAAAFCVSTYRSSIARRRYSECRCGA